MSVRLTGEEDAPVALYDSVTGWAFGPTFPSLEAAREFLDWMDGRNVSDPRGVSPVEMHGLWEEFQNEHMEER